MAEHISMLCVQTARRPDQCKLIACERTVYVCPRTGKSLSVPVPTPNEPWLMSCHDSMMTARRAPRLLRKDACRRGSQLAGACPAATTRCAWKQRKANQGEVVRTLPVSCRNLPRVQAAGMPRTGCIRREHGTSSRLLLPLPQPRGDATPDPAAVQPKCSPNAYAHDRALVSHRSCTSSVLCPAAQQGHPNPNERCSLPGCSAPRFFDREKNRQEDFCGKTHAIEAKQRGLLPAAQDFHQALVPSPAAVVAVWRGRRGEEPYAIAELTNVHPTRQNVKQQFLDAWEHPGRKPTVERVYQCALPAMLRFESNGSLGSQRATVRVQQDHKPGLGPLELHGVPGEHARPQGQRAAALPWHDHA